MDRLFPFLRVQHKIEQSGHRKIFSRGKERKHGSEPKRAAERAFRRAGFSRGAGHGRVFEKGITRSAFATPAAAGPHPFGTVRRKFRCAPERSRRRAGPAGPGRDCGISRRPAAAVYGAAGSRRNAVSIAGVESTAADSVRPDALLRGDCSRHRPAQSGPCRWDGQPFQSGGHHRPVPSRHRRGRVAGRLCRRTQNESQSPAPGDFRERFAAQSGSV